MLLSIIVFIDGNQTHIKECLTSLIKQQRKDLEIILVSKSLTSECKTIIDNTLNDIKIVRSPYDGTLSRYEGFKESSGKYVWFIDCNFELICDSLDYVFNLIRSDSIDAIITDVPFSIKEGVDYCNKKINQSPCNNNIHHTKDVDLIQKNINPYNLIVKRDLISSILSNTDADVQLFGALLKHTLVKKIKTIVSLQLPLIKCNSYCLSYCDFDDVGLDIEHINNYMTVINALIRDSDDIYAISIIDTLAKCVVDKTYNVTNVDKYAFFKKTFEQLHECLTHSIDFDLEKIDKNAIYSTYHEICSNLSNENKNDIVPIVVGCDDDYLPQLSVLLCSIKKQSKEGLFYNVYILHSAPLNQERLKMVQNISSNCFSITAIDTSQYLVFPFLYEYAHYTYAMYNRFIAPLVIPFYSKILYLDCDMIVLSDVSKLFEINLNENIIAAVRCTSSPQIEEYVQNQLKMDSKQYFNTGMLLIDNEKYKESKIASLCFQMIEEKSWFLCPDQDALNISCLEKVLLLPGDEWNYQWHMKSKNENIEQYQGIKIIHYTSGKKPWNSADNTLSMYFWDCAKETEFYDELLKIRASKRQSLVKKILKKVMSFFKRT